MAIPVPGYPDYTVSENGDIYSHKTNRYLRHNINTGGYHSVELFNEHGSRRLLVHRIVASVYIPNPNNHPQINHINEDKSDNSVQNLEWCTAKYNMNYGEAAKTRMLHCNTRSEARLRAARENGKSKARPILQIDGENVVRKFENAHDAQRETGVHFSHILNVAKGQRKTAGGFRWAYGKEC